MVSTLQETPRAERLHIAVFGKTNAGKSTLLNGLSGQEMALVSPVPGTTTDPVYKAMELLPLGAVVLIDTAGLDDTTELGELRTEKTRSLYNICDFAILVIADSSIQEERGYLAELQAHKIPVLAVLNKFDGIPFSVEPLGIPTIAMDAKEKKDYPRLKEAIIQALHDKIEEVSLTRDFVKAGDLVVLVMPQDLQAPKGRLILPQVQTIRDLLDNHAMVVSIQADDVKKMLATLKIPPALVICDSQIFAKINTEIPPEIPLTSFSVLFSRYKGDIQSFMDGAKALDTLQKEDKILIMEACTHHALEDDITREKLPKLLEKYKGFPVSFAIFSGAGFPSNLERYHMMIHCGGCMLNRQGMLSKINQAHASGIPITNFGIAIAYMNGMLNRITV